ncbi:MAG: hypothetical protein CMJ35_13020 [Phycisphaerae bacterium]|nr:hypothetical protein [Phycisphaerae bacterium]HCT43648.1 hypothetical protein [Phycisphaerales bacterium]
MYSALAMGALSMPLHAEIREVRYDFPTNAGTALLYGYFGGDSPVEGSIISTTLFIEGYTTTGGTDAADFFMGFDVPVLDATSTQIRLEGSDLGWSGVGSFSHGFTTDDYNGVIRPGRFGAEFSGGGTFVGDAYVTFTVDTTLVPAPGTCGVLLGAGLVGVRRRR